MEYEVMPGMKRDIANGRPFKRFRPTWFLLGLYDRTRDSRYDAQFTRVWSANNTATMPKDAQGVPTFQPGDTALYVSPTDADTVLARTRPFRVYTPLERLPDGSPRPLPYADNIFPSLNKFHDPFRLSINETRGSRDYLLFRLAETESIAAEALLRDGRAAEGLDHLNRVRRRTAPPGLREARRRQLLATEVLTRQGDRDGKGARDALRQLQVGAPAVRAVRDGAGGGAKGNRGRGTPDRRRRSDLVRPGQRSGRGEILRVRAGRRHAAHHRARRPGAAAPHRALRQAVRHQGRVSQPRPRGQELPVPVRRLEARPEHGSTDGAVHRYRAHRPHRHRRRAGDRGRGPTAPRHARQGLARFDGEGESVHRRRGRHPHRRDLGTARDDRIPWLRQLGVRDRRRRPVAGHEAVVRLYARRARRARRRPPSPTFLIRGGEMSKHRKKMPRREFVKVAAATVGALPAARYAKILGANDRVRVGIVGL